MARRAYPIIGGFALAIAIWRLVGIVFKRCLKEFIWGTHSHDYDKQMPVGFRDLGDEMAISAYVPTVPHPVPGEPPLIAANITGLPDDFLPLPPGKPKEFYTICNRGYMGESPFGAVRDLAPAHMQSDFQGLLKDLLHDIFGEVQFWGKEGTTTDADHGTMSAADAGRRLRRGATPPRRRPRGRRRHGGYGGMGCVDPDAPTPSCRRPRRPRCSRNRRTPAPRKPKYRARPAAPRPARPAMPLPAVPRPPPRPYRAGARSGRRPRVSVTTTRKRRVDAARHGPPPAPLSVINQTLGGTGTREPLRSPEFADETLFPGPRIGGGPQAGSRD